MNTKTAPLGISRAALFSYRRKRPHLFTVQKTFNFTSGLSISVGFHTLYNMHKKSAH